MGIVLLLIAVLIANERVLSEYIWQGQSEIADPQGLNFIGQISGCGPDEKTNYLTQPHLITNISAPTITISTSNLVTGLYFEVEAFYLPQNSRYLIDIISNSSDRVFISFSEVYSMLTTAGTCSNRKPLNGSTSLPIGYFDHAPNVLEAPLPDPSGTLHTDGLWKVSTEGCSKIKYTLTLGLNDLPTCYWYPNYLGDNIPIFTLTEENVDGRSEEVVSAALAVSIVSLDGTADVLGDTDNFTAITWVYPFSATFGRFASSVTQGSSGQGDLFVKRVTLSTANGKMTMRFHVEFIAPPATYARLADPGLSINNTTPDPALLLAPPGITMRIIENFSYTTGTPNVAISTYSAETDQPPENGVYDGDYVLPISTLACDDNYNWGDVVGWSTGCTIMQAKVVIHVSFYIPPEITTNANLTSTIEMYDADKNGFGSPNPIIPPVQTSPVIALGRHICMRDYITDMSVSSPRADSSGQETLFYQFTLESFYLCARTPRGEPIQYNPSEGKYGCLDSPYKVALWENGMSTIYTEPFNFQTSDIGHVMSLFNISYGKALSNFMVCFLLKIAAAGNVQYYALNGEMFIHVVGGVSLLHSPLSRFVREGQQEPKKVSLQRSGIIVHSVNTPSPSSSKESVKDVRNNVAVIYVTEGSESDNTGSMLLIADNNENVNWRSVGVAIALMLFLLLAVLVAAYVTGCVFVGQASQPPKGSEQNEWSIITAPVYLLREEDKKE